MIFRQNRLPQLSGNNRIYFKIKSGRRVMLPTFAIIECIDS